MFPIAELTLAENTLIYWEIMRSLIIRDILFKIKDKFLQGSGRTSEP